MKEEILKIISKLDELSRAVERGDRDLSDFREDLLALYVEVKDKVL